MSILRNGHIECIDRDEKVFGDCFACVDKVMKLLCLYIVLSDDFQHRKYFCFLLIIMKRGECIHNDSICAKIVFSIPQ